MFPVYSVTHVPGLYRAQSSVLSTQSSLLTSAGFGGSFLTSDVPQGRASACAMLTAPTGRLTSAVKARDDLTLHVDHLALHVDPEARIAIVDHRPGPGSVKRRGLDLVLRGGFFEVRVVAKSTMEL